MTNAIMRRAAPSDAPELARLIDELAAYEKLGHASRPDPSRLAQHLDSEASPRVEAFLAQVGTDVAGFALFYPSYSTFLTGWGVFLEDLFVRPAFRGQGIGFALLQQVAREAVRRGAKRLEWNVLEWNALAIDFYERIGAKTLQDWRLMRLDGSALERLGGAEAIG